MLNQNKTLIETLHELGLTPLDWVDAEQFAELTGIAKQKLTHRKQAWPENVVWMKEAGNLYYSIKGYNKWMTQQADIRYRQACGLDREAFRSTLNETTKNTISNSRIQRLQRVSVQLLKLDAT